MVSNTVMCVCMGKEITYIAITAFDDLFSNLVVCSLTNTNLYGLASPVLLSVSAFQPHSSILLVCVIPSTGKEVSSLLLNTRELVLNA